MLCFKNYQNYFKVGKYRNLLFCTNVLIAIDKSRLLAVGNLIYSFLGIADFDR